MRAIEHALRAGTIVHLVGGTETKVRALVEEAADDREIRTVACESTTIAEQLPEARLPEDTFVHYAGFGKLEPEVQTTAAQLIKGHFEYGTPVIVSSSEAARGDLTLRNGDLTGRVRAVELDSGDGES
jgi:hypothetical protein